MTISNECMVLNLQIGLWAGHRLDKDASQRVTTEANADADAVRVNKHLVPKAAMQPILTATSGMRNHFYLQTLPWKDNGDRLLPRKMYEAFIVKHGEHVQRFEGEVSRFLDVTYPQARDQAEFRMGSLFKLDDYPAAEALRNRYYVNLDIDAISEAGDFRVKLDESSLELIKGNMQRAVEIRMSKAMYAVWERLADVLGHYATCLASDASLRKPMVTNLEEIVAMLPDMNILNDPDLERIRKRIEDTLIGFDVHQFRSDTTTRKAVASEAQAIMQEMSGFMNAFTVK